LGGVHDFRAEGKHISFSLDNEAMPAVLEQIAALEPIGLTINPPSLEDLFLSHYKSEDGMVSGK
jgi:ABC-2 type transport system ATP-binding protein